MKRVVFLFICDEWGTSLGGVSAFNFQMVKEMALCDNTDVYVILTGATDFKSAEEVEAVKRDSKVSLRYPVMQAGKIISIPCPMPNVVVAHGDISGKQAVHLKTFPQFRNSKFWLFNHTDPEKVDPYKGVDFSAQRTSKKIDEYLELSRKFDAIFSVGAFIHDSWARSYGGIGVTVPHFVYYPPLNHFFHCDSEFKATKSTFRILLFGRVSDTVSAFKGIRIALRAAKFLSERISSFHVELMIRGIPPGDAHEQFPKLQSDCGNSVQVIPKEFGTPEELRRDLLEANVCIVPARYEPFGLTGLEAIACGTPVLISINTGLADSLKKHFGPLV